MPRRDIEFKTSDHVTLRGWLFTPEKSSSKLPCLIMSHGWTALKEMDLDTFAEYFTSKLSIACVVYDNRGFGASDAAPNAPRCEILPELQRSDYSDAITYAQSLEEVDGDKIGIWGSSYSGGHVLFVGAVDRRVKAVLSQVPLTDGWTNFHRLIRPDFVAGMESAFLADRAARAQGKDAAMIPVVDADPTKPSSLPTPDSYEFFAAWEKKSDWKNENDVLTPTDIALDAYTRAREPKQLHMISGGHFDGYSGPNFEKNAGRQAQFLKETLCAGEEAALSLR
ncbi:hypothetical protein B0A48_16666 [Cryoendolithus antarcticus]|uniref:Xaa-Pro dipeptidyl-peptidase-like domain-containing protein n=1 Tax=Cryoendolithus antarcticus TaxID=1507870 RepID=A0A1V8SEI4_9PEZI|nr:hypothetical protein B0A48_16666 [Cryoendolithus antarcticus]